MNAPHAARRALESLSGRVDESVLERGLLVVTELITNSVRHARLAPEQQIGLRVSAQRDLLRLEVTDEGTGFDPTSRSRDPDLPKGGWGLWIVARLAVRWGIDTSHSTRVWCELESRA
jgi:anti-sigma regulatory factor (Ser/Thr protein kinase)